MRRVLPGVGLALGVLCLAIVVRLLPSYYIGLLTEALILGIFAMSLNLLMGHTGIPSLGHAAYFGAGAYTMALLSLRVVQNSRVSAAGVLVSVVIAALYGLLALWTSGVYCLMITLALAQVLWGIAYGWRTMTGGDDGLPGIARPDLGGLLPWSLHVPANFFTAVLLVFAVVVAALYLVVHSARLLRCAAFARARRAWTAWGITSGCTNTSLFSSPVVWPASPGSSSPTTMALSVLRS